MELVVIASAPAARATRLTIIGENNILYFPFLSARIEYQWMMRKNESRVNPRQEETRRRRSRVHVEGRGETKKREGAKAGRIPLSGGHIKGTVTPEIKEHSPRSIPCGYFQHGKKEAVSRWAEPTHIAAVSISSSTSPAKLQPPRAELAIQLEAGSADHGLLVCLANNLFRGPPPT